MAIVDLDEKQWIIGDNVEIACTGKAFDQDNSFLSTTDLYDFFMMLQKIP